jgi:hypothetical protein
MDEKIAVVVTSIAGANRVLQDLAKGCKEKDYQFIVIGDEASPADFHLDGCDFYSLGRQYDTEFDFARRCPTRHYARKNIGYLVAIANGATVIIETDDDNIPYEKFWQLRQLNQTVKTIVGAEWVNMYRYFSDVNIWPRGLDLKHILKPVPDYDSLETREIECPIQQGLADGDPDVDAIYRLTLPLPQSFRKDRDVALSQGCVCPFNSQNTSWFARAFMLMYLPSYCSFRMTDIWRSFIAQKIAYLNDWGILFHEPTVFQERNEHDLMRDFEDELPGYLNNSKICRELDGIELKAGTENIPDNLHMCYEKLIEMGLVDMRETALLEEWIKTVSTLMKNT